MHGARGLWCRVLAYNILDPPPPVCGALSAVRKVITKNTPARDPSPAGASRRRGRLSSLQLYEYYTTSWPVYCKVVLEKICRRTLPHDGHHARTCRPPPRRRDASSATAAGNRPALGSCRPRRAAVGGGGSGAAFSFSFESDIAVQSTRFSLSVENRRMEVIAASGTFTL